MKYLGLIEDCILLFIAEDTLYYASPVVMLSIIIRVFSVHVNYPVPCRIAIRS